MPKIEMPGLPDGWWLNEFTDKDGHKFYRLIQNHYGTPAALCEYQELPSEITVRRAIQRYLEWQ